MPRPETITDTEYGKLNFRELEIASGIPLGSLRSRYRKGMRGADLIKPVKWEKKAILNLLALMKYLKKQASQRER